MVQEALERLLKELAGGGVVVASAWWLGRALLARFAGGWTKLELELFSFGVGAAALSQILFWLGLLGLYHDVVFVALAAGCLGAWWRWGRSPLAEADASDQAGAFWGRAAAAIAVFYGPLYILNALAPDWGADSLGYHLGLVSRYYRERGLVAATENIYGLFPQGAEMLYLFAFAFGRHNAPQLLHFAFFLATLPALVALGRRLGGAGVGWTAALLYGLSPVVAVDAIIAYNDCMLAFFGVMTLYALLLWRERPSQGLAAVTGVLAGFCFAVKLTGGLVVVAAGAAMLWPADGRLRFRHALLYTAAAALFVLPWTGRNLALTGSPVAPFYNEIFPNPYSTVAWEQEFRDYVSDYRHRDERSEPVSVWAHIAEVTIDGRRNGGVVGPVFWAAPLALLGWRRRGVAPLWMALAVGVAPWFSNAGTRFLIPGLPFLALLMAQGAASLGRGARPASLALVVFHAVSSWPHVFEKWHPAPGIFRIQEAPWRVVLGLEPWEAYVQWRLAPFVGARGLAKSAPPGSRALVFSHSADAYFPGVLLDSRFSVAGADALRDLQMSIDPDRAPTRVVRLVWDEPAAFSEIRLEQTASSPVEWEIAEIRTIPETPIRVEIDRVPWTADRLADGDRLTVWRSWAPLTPDRIVISLDQPAEIRGLEIIAPANQHFPQYRIEHPHRVEIDRLEAPLSELRAAAHKSLQKKGIGYLLGEPSADGHSTTLRPIELEPAAWGMEEVWREDSWRAFRVLDVQPARPAAHRIQ